MGSQGAEMLASLPDLLREGKRLRDELDLNVARLKVTLERSKAVAVDWGYPTEWPSRVAPAVGETHLLASLTRRELEVLRLIAEGKSTKQVANLLGIAFRTAVCHRYRIFQKLHVHETASLVRLAVRAGLVEA